MPLRDLPDVITVEEAAAVLRIGRTVAYEQARRWRATGGREGLPVLTLGRRLLVPRAGLERMLGADPVGSGQGERENDQDPGEGRSTPGAVSVESGHGDPAPPHVELPFVSRSPSSRGTSPDRSHPALPLRPRTPDSRTLPVTMNRTPEPTPLNEDHTLAPCGAGRLPDPPGRSGNGSRPC